MNRSAANALLKVLEEPPRRRAAIVGQPQSRPAAADDPLALPAFSARAARASGGDAAAAGVTGPKLAEPEAAALAMLCDGQHRRALELALPAGWPSTASIVELLSRVPGIDLARLHAFADQLARADAEDGYRAGAELLSRFLARMAVGRPATGSLNRRSCR